MVILTGIYYILMEDCAGGFLKNGCEVLYPGVRRSAADPQIFYSETAFRQTVRDGRYDIFFAINGDCLDDSGDIARELMDLKKTIVLWYVDDPFNPYAPWNITRRLGGAAVDYEKLIVFAIDEGFVERLKSLGYRNVYYLPHAVNPEWAGAGAPLASPPAAPITFVGNLDLDNLERFEGMLSEFPEPAAKMALAYVDARQSDFCLSWEEFANDSVPEEVPHIARRLATIRCKIHAVQLIEKLGVNVYGFEDWKRVLKNPESYKGHVPYYAGLASVYRTSFLTLNLSHAQLSRGCNQRVLDVPACGGTIVTDSRAAIRDLLPGTRVPMYRTPADLVRRIQEIIRNPELRASGRESVLGMVRERHTYEHRMKTVLNIAGRFM